MLQNGICCLLGVPIPFHRYIENVKCLSSTSLLLQLDHTKFPLSYLYVYKIIKKKVINDRDYLRSLLQQI